VPYHIDYAEQVQYDVVPSPYGQILPHSFIHQLTQSLFH
jgi:hypothetical protein